MLLLVAAAATTTQAATFAVDSGAPAAAAPLPPHPALQIDDKVPRQEDNATANKIAHFSWYAYGADLPGKAYTNLAMNGNLTFLRGRYEELGVPGMLLLVQSKWGIDGLQNRGAPWIHVSNPVFGFGPAFVGPAFVGLSATWEAAVDDCIATITPLAKGNGGHIHGIQIGDELVCPERWWHRPLSARELPVGLHLDSQESTGPFAGRQLLLRAANPAGGAPTRHDLHPRL